MVGCVSTDLEYARPTDVPRPVFVLRITALVALAVVISEAHLIVRPTELAWESMWAFGVLPLLIVAAVAGFGPIAQERLWLTVTAIVAIIVTLVPIGEGWDAVSIAFDQTSSFGYTMVHLQLGNNVEELVLILSSLTLIITCTALRYEPSRLLRSIALLVVCMPSAASRLDDAWQVLMAAMRADGVTPIVWMFTSASVLVITMLVMLPWGNPRFARRLAWTCLTAVGVLAAVQIYLVATVLGPAELVRPRLVSNKLGPLLLTAAPALAILTTFKPKLRS